MDLRRAGRRRLARAGALLGLGLHAGDRVAAYGRNSDAYLLGFLGCSRAGLVHVRVDLRADRRRARLPAQQSGSRAVLFTQLREPLDAVRGDRDALALRDADGSLLARAAAGDVPEIDAGAADDALVQLL